jgi:hypothetical protein
MGLTVCYAYGFGVITDRNYTACEARYALLRFLRSFLATFYGEASFADHLLIQSITARFKTKNKLIAMKLTSSLLDLVTANGRRLFYGPSLPPTEIDQSS